MGRGKGKMIEKESWKHIIQTNKKNLVNRSKIGELQVKDIGGGHKLPNQVMLYSSKMPGLKLMKAWLRNTK